VRFDPEVQQVVNSYQLGLPRMPVAGRTGELLGRGSGSSLEFQEYREYMLGDDIRHLDWAAYARSDSLMVRLYREEISPRTEILLDVSRSMTSGGTIKPQVARQLTATFSLLVSQLGGRPKIILLGDERPLGQLDIENIDVLDSIPFDSISNMAELFEQNLIPFGRQSVRIVISDFLFQHDPASLIKRLAAGCCALWVIQLLNGWEANPTRIGGRRLIDIESNHEIDLLLDKKTIDAYKNRLKRLQDELARNCRRVHAPFVISTAENGLQQICRSDLCAAEILRVS